MTFFIDKIKNNYFLLSPNQLQKGVLWNFLSFVVLALSGIILNILIVLNYGTDALGVFNQVYAVYVLASQLAVFGLYASVLKYVSEYSEDKEKCDGIMTSAVLLCAFIAAIISFLYFYAASFFGDIFHSPDVGKGVALSSIGLWFFAMNKVFLSFLNGKSLMKEFALFYIFRYLALLASLIVLIIFGFSGSVIPLIFTSAEFFLFFVLIFFLFKFRGFSFSARDFFDWIKKHFIFGAKSFIGGGVIEVNARVDVVMIGIFLSDKAVGVYSFASMIAEGAAHIPSIFKANYDPILTKLITNSKFDELSALIKSFLKKWMPPAIILAVILALIFPLAGKMFLEEDEFVLSWIIFSILIIGTVIKSGYDVFWNLPSQAGFPVYQTVLILSVALSNIFLNYFLISSFGLYGAAAELTISALFGIFLLRKIVRKIIGISI